MIFEQPIWLLLLLPSAVGLWLWRAPTRLLQALRIAALVLTILAMARPTLVRSHRAGTVVVIADHSLSMPGNAVDQQQEAIDLIQQAMAPEDRLAVVTFGRQAVVERSPGVGAFAGFTADVGGDASSLADAIARGLSLIPRESPGRLLVLSDGRWTGRDPAGEAGRAATRGIGIDYRVLSRSLTGDVAIQRIDAPVSVAAGEGFMLTAWVRAPTAQPITYELRRGTVVLATGTYDAPAGLSRLTFRDRADEATTLQYQLVVTGAADDPVPENNRARLLVGVDGPRVVLCISPSPDSSFAHLLRRAGLDVQVRMADDADLSLEALSGYAAVILENVPADRIGASGMENLAAWIQGGGGGLMMTGGRHGFGPGGYFESPLDPLLPVSMELRQEHRKLALAMVVVLDRSGSMSAPVGGGRTKMDLANLGTAQVLDLLSPMDEFGVIAVDSRAHVIADLAPVAQKQPIRDRILRIESMGGGIFVYEGLSEAAAMLVDAQASTRHIILFADAMDSEQPGNYRELLEKAGQANISVSVIGLGTEHDVDAPLLKDIAARGNGRAFFTDDATQLPRLFAQDTFVVARSSFIDEPTPVASTAALRSLLGRSLSAPPAVGGYNLTYARPEAQVALVTQDDYHAPVVAAWRAGTGRVAVYTGEADGSHAGPIARWADVGEMYAGLARWTAGESDALRDDMLVTHEVDRGISTIQLHLDPRRPEMLGMSPPMVSLVRSGIAGPVIERQAMTWTSPHTLELVVALQGDEVLLPTVDVPGEGPVRLAPATLPYSPEYLPVEDEPSREPLAQLAAATGGQNRVQLASIWQALPRVPQPSPVAHWLLLVAVGVVLLEVFERRTGLLSTARLGRARQVQRDHEPRAAVRPRSPRRSAPSAAPVPEKGTPNAPSKPAPSGGLGQAMRDAQRRADERSRSRKVDRGR